MLSLPSGCVLQEAEGNLPQLKLLQDPQLSARWQADGERLELETECCAAALEKLLAGEPGRITGRSVLDLARSDLA